MLLKGHIAAIKVPETDRRFLNTNDKNVIYLKEIIRSSPFSMLTLFSVLEGLNGRSIERWAVTTVALDIIICNPHLSLHKTRGKNYDARKKLTMLVKICIIIIIIMKKIGTCAFSIIYNNTLVRT